MADATRFLPLTHLGFHVLLTLAEGPGHGYAIIREVERRSDGLVSPGTGSFYEVMRKLRADGLIEDSPSPAGDDARRKHYRLTRLGADVLRLEAARLETLLREARRIGFLAKAARA